MPIPLKLIVELFRVALASLTLSLFQIILKTLPFIFKFSLSQVRTVAMAIPLVLCFPNPLLIGMNLSLG